MARRRAVTIVGRRVALLLLVVYVVPRQVLAQVSPDALFASASPAVVKLAIKDENDREIGTGSGFVVAFEEKVTGDARHFESKIITNYHVIYPAVEIEVLFQNKGTGKAWQVLVEDASADIAVLTVSSSAKPEQLLKLCDGEAAAIGTKVLTIGNPLGLTNTLSEGLVSGYRERESGSRWMQISAPISPGSSGGPVMSADGCVLGITTATIKNGQNLNFAIPAKDIQQALNGLKKPRAVWAGASVQREEDDAMFRVLERAVTRCKERVDPSEEESVARCLADGVEEGDQLALLATGCPLFGKKQYDVARLKRAAEAKPGEFAYFAHYSQGKALFDTGVLRPFQGGPGKANPAYEQALPSWIKAKELRADFAPTRAKLADAYSVLKRYPEALLEADSVVSLLPRCYKGYVLRGRVWAALGRREAFERDFEKAVLLRPDDPDVYHEKAYSFGDLKDLDSSIEAHLQAISIDADYLLSHIDLVYLYTDVGQCEKAMEHYKKATGVGDDAAVVLRRELEPRMKACRAGARRLP